MTDIFHNYDSLSVKRAVLLSIVVAIPMVVDIFLDAGSLFSPWENKLFWSTRFILAASLTIPNMVLLGNLGDDELSPRVGLLFICVMAFHFMNGTGCVAALVSQQVISSKSLPRTLLTQNLLILTSSIIAQLSFSFCGIQRNLDMRKNLLLIGELFFLLSTLQILALSVSWGLSLRRKKVSWIRLSPDEICISFYILSLVGKCVVMITIIQQTKWWCCGGIANLDQYKHVNWSSVFSQFMYMQLVFTVVVLILPGRSARIQAFQTKQLMEEKVSFIRYISHEIRTPLNTVSVGLDYMNVEVDTLQAVVGTEKMRNLRESLSGIVEHCRSALRILDDLLTFDKLEGGKLVVEFENLHPLEYLVDAWRYFAVQAQQKNIQYTFPEIVDFPWASTFVVRVDKYKFANALRNLISNAIKFTPVRGQVVVRLKKMTQYEAKDDLAARSKEISVHESASITSRIDDSNQILRIEVVDTGVGMSASNQRKLFNQYVQFNVDSARPGKGPGLGLWTAKGRKSQWDF